MFKAHQYEVTAVRKSDSYDVVLPPMKVWGQTEVKAVKAAIKKIYSGDSVFTVKDLTAEMQMKCPFYNRSLCASQAQ
ncbi:MAG TPA: hypothetical protein VHV10_20315 [Ktedonobacteraceae bacterium]|nr:hypothetical protein [Ktedonobacteraceae bacterium]